MKLQKASRQKVKLRLGLSAVSGGGKTYSALLIAKGFCGSWDKVAVIDTENDSASLYSHLGDFNTLSLRPPFSPERYVEAIRECEKAGMEFIIIDSIAHEWEGEGGILQLCDTMGGGFQNAWKQLTPRHEKFKQAILQSTCHIITTVRRKQEYALQESTNRQGKTVQSPVKLGLKEITREGWEYEVTLNLEIDVKHYATSSKDRTGLFANGDPFIITEETGRKLHEWCDEGVEAPAPWHPTPDQSIEIADLLTGSTLKSDQYAAVLKRLNDCPDQSGYEVIREGLKKMQKPKEVVA
jgi:hypothetical protein